MEHTVLLFIVTLFATATWHMQEGESVVVRSQRELLEAYKELLQNSGMNKIRDSRSANHEEGDTRSQHICDHNPCGWAIYKKFTREVNDFVKNMCECADDTYKCVHVEDDLSIGAYVYRCRQNTTANDTVAPPGDTN